MKIQILTLLAISTSTVWFGFPLEVLAQGPLTPPGSPAPLMKTLDQIEPRKPISALPFSITVSGSYLVTTNLHFTNTSAHGISISAPNVALDLGGFTLSATTNTGHGIQVGSTATNVVIRNGTLRGWGSSGLGAHSARHGRVEQLRSISNLQDGIGVGANWLILDCDARDNGDNGIEFGGNCIVDRCSASNNKGDGFLTFGGHSIIKNCVLFQNASHGLHLQGAANSVENCQISSSGLHGINATFGGQRVERTTLRLSAQHGIRLLFCCNVITENIVIENGWDGIVMQNDGHIARNHCLFNGTATNNGAGIRLMDSENRVEDNQLNGNDLGLVAAGTQNFIIRNYADANTTNYVVSGTQNIGPIVTTTGTITNVNPWANFSY